MTGSQQGGLKAIVHACIQSTATAMGIPEAVTRRLVRVADNLASGELDPSAGPEIQRRIELVFNGYETPRDATVSSRR